MIDHVREESVKCLNFFLTPFIFANVLAVESVQRI